MGNSLTSDAQPQKPALPREHGAWGILLVPFVGAVAVAGQVDLKIWLLLVSALSFYLARGSYLKQRMTWTAALVAVSLAAGAALVWHWRLWWLIAFGAVTAPFAFRKTERKLGMQCLAAAALTLTAPAAWYVATCRCDRTAWVLWGFNLLYFCGGILYVRMHIAAAVERTAGKWQLGWPTLAYHAVLAGVAGATWPVGLALVPAVLRAGAGTARLTPRLRIKRLAWTEVAYSILFMALLVMGMRRELIAK